MKVTAGKLDRRIRIEFCREVRDASNDVVQKWAPGDGDWFHLWAKKNDKLPTFVLNTYADDQQDLKEMDTIFRVRNGEKARSIAPEICRVVYKGRAYLIIGKRETGDDREETLDLFCTSRPDMRGSRGLEAVSGTTGT